VSSLAGKRVDSRAPQGDAAGQNASRRRYVPLFWRVLAVNVLLVTAAAVTTVAVLPERFSSLAEDEAAILGLALIATLVANTLLLRRALAPLQRLTTLLRDVDPLSQGRRLEVPRAPSEAADLARAYNEMLDHLERERHESTRRAVAAQESERLRVAQELHDEVGQTLTGVLLQLARLQREAPPALADQVTHTSETARASLEDIRRIAQRLRPEALDDLGLAGALDVLCTRVAEQSGLAIAERLDEDPPPLAPETELTIYRIAQEALTNVVRHADARRATLTLRRTRERLSLVITDDGRGLPSATVAHTGGLRGMRERAALIGAALALESEPGAGTTVRLELPLAEDAP
jgi:two-component system, NarL family, sensor histidine kinase UhpB